MSRSPPGAGGSMRGSGPMCRSWPYTTSSWTERRSKGSLVVDGLRDQTGVPEERPRSQSRGRPDRRLGVAPKSPVEAADLRRVAIAQSWFRWEEGPKDQDASRASVSVRSMGRNVQSGWDWGRWHSTCACRDVRQPRQLIAARRARGSLRPWQGAGPAGRSSPGPARPAPGRRRGRPA